ncbi:hypothetical protein P9112_010403 [Eukaryota sp. TZLM1-RC]
MGFHLWVSEFVAYFNLIGLEESNNFDLIYLPHSLGGLGFLHLGQVAHICYSVSVYLAVRDLDLTNLIPSDQYRVLLSALSPSFAGFDSIWDKRIKICQRQITHLFYKEKLSLLKEKLSECERLQFISNCDSQSFCFLKVLPISQNFTFSDDCFKYLINLRLLQGEQFVICPLCGYGDLGLDHSFQCRKVSRMVTQRHDEVNNFINELNNFESEKEFKFGLNKQLRVDGFQTSTKIAFDVTIVGGYGNNWSDAFSKAYSDKIAKYSILKELNLINQIVPLVFSVHGGFYTKTKVLFDQFGWNEVANEISCIILKNSFKCHSAFNYILQKKREDRQCW